MLKLKFLATALLLSAALLPEARAQQSEGARSARSAGRGVGIGAILGEPTGFTAKFWTGSREAVDAGLAFSLSDFFLLYGDYLHHFRPDYGSASSRFLEEVTPYIGIGAELFISTKSNRSDRKFFTEPGASSVGFGIRIPLGAEWLPRNVPLGVFVELVPGVGILPGTFAFLQGGVGIRYYF